MTIYERVCYCVYCEKAKGAFVYRNGPICIRKPLTVLASLNVLSEPKRALSEPEMVFQGSLGRLRSQDVS